MAGIEVGSDGGKRQVNSEINMIPFIDMLLVTIAFLLITAVWVTFSRVEATARVPGTETGPVPPDVSKVLHVYATSDAFVVSWMQAGTVITETRLPRESDARDLDELGALIAREYKQHGGHQDPSDLTRDLCVLHTDDQMSFGDMVAVMDAILEAKREIVAGGKRHVVPAFHTALGAR